MNFESIFETIGQSVQGAGATGQALSVRDSLLCMAVALICGIIVGGAYMIKSEYSKNFVISLVILPVIVQIVIMLVNGSLGTAVAIVGAFSLIRFRSVPGTAKEISCVFLTMAIGLATGMGYLTFALCITFVVSIVLVLLNLLPIGNRAAEANVKILRVTIPENLDYSGIYNDLFEEHFSHYELQRVKTTNMGSMYELTYQVTFKDLSTEKKLIDDMRCRNGNLPISSSIPQTSVREEVL